MIIFKPSSSEEGTAWKLQENSLCGLSCPQPFRKPGELAIEPHSHSGWNQKHWFNGNSKEIPSIET